MRIADNIQYILLVPEYITKKYCSYFVAKFVTDESESLDDISLESFDYIHSALVGGLCVLYNKDFLNTRQLLNMLYNIENIKDKDDLLNYYQDLSIIVDTLNELSIDNIRKNLRLIAKNELDIIQRLKYNKRIKEASESKLIKTMNDVIRNTTDRLYSTYAADIDHRYSECELYTKLKDQFDEYTAKLIIATIKIPDLTSNYINITFASMFEKNKYSDPEFYDFALCSCLSDILSLDILKYDKIYDICIKYFELKKTANIAELNAYIKDFAKNYTEKIKLSREAL